MDEVDRRVIQLHIEALSTDTNFNLLWNNLNDRNEHNMITPRLRQKYMQLQEKETPNYDLNKQFYGDIQTRGEKAFGILVECLQTIHPNLAELLLPTESVLAVDEQSLEESESSEECESAEENADFRGYCIVTGDHEEKTRMYNSVKKLCHAIGAQLTTYIDDVVQNIEFLLIINVTDEIGEDQIQKFKAHCARSDNFKLIISNIQSIQSTRQPMLNQNALSRYDAANVFIVNIYTHPGDHLCSVLHIIRKVIVNNPRFDIRDVFHVVTEKLAERGCKLNTESRSFPKFSFDLQT